MKKMNFTSIALRFAFLALGLFSMVATTYAQRNSNCGPEKATIYLSRGTCKATLTVADLGGTATQVTIKKPGLPAVPVTLPYEFSPTNSALPQVLGAEYEVMYMGQNGSMCYTYIKILDGDCPLVIAIPDAFVRCNELVNGKAPAPGAVFFGKSLTATRMKEPIGKSGRGQLLNPFYLGTGRDTFQVDDCSNFYVNYYDETGEYWACPTAQNCFATQIIYRHFNFKDIYGNACDYVQTIYVIKPPIRFPGIPTMDPHTWRTVYTNEVLCTDPIAKVGLPFVDWSCDGIAQAEEIAIDGADYCSQSVTLVSTNQMPLCPGSYMITRTWKVRKCDNTFETIDQIVNVRDRHMPLLGFNYWDYLRVPEAQCFKMGDMKITEFVYKPVVVDVLDGYGGHFQPATGVNGLDQPFHKVLKVSPLVDLGECNRASIKLGLNISDPNCNSYPIKLTSNDNRITFDGMESMTIGSAKSVMVRGTFEALPGEPDPFVIISATDACGNVVRVKLVIVVIDNISPNAICEDKDITLSSNGQALINGKTLSDRSDDNCYIKRKLVKFKGTECWSEELILDCAHIGIDSIDVRLIDKCENFTDCCVRVVVKDKTGPSCPMSPEVSTFCNDTRLTTIDAFFTQPVAYDNCETPAVKESTTPLVLSCGKGEVIKSWTFTDKGGNSTVCTQKLIIKPVPGYRVTRLRSEDYTCTPHLEDDKTRILKSIKNLDAQGNVTCSAPVIKITEMIYMSTDYCKRIMRTYELIDLCLTPQPTCTETPQLASDFSGTLEVQDRNGAVCWSRIITILDKTPPVAGKVADKEVCVIDNTCAANFPPVTLTATDACTVGGTSVNTAPTYLFYRWDVTGANGVVASGNGNGAGASNSLTIEATATNGLANLPLGTYYVTYVIVDDCGNVGTGSPVKIVIKDCKSPYINTHDKNTVLAYTNTVGQGMSVVKVAELLNAVRDNCTPESFLVSKLKFVRAESNPSNTYPAGAGTEIMFTCADLNGTNPVPVQIWTVDQSDNKIFNIAYITVEDNLHACNGAIAHTTIAGGLKTETNQAAKSVTLSASANGTIANSITTDNNGAFSFNVAQGGNYVVKATKTTTDDKYAGVTTFDIARISKHLLDIEKFGTAYQVIAADVDKSGDVDGADMLHIRNFILRKSTTLPGGVWRFVDKSYSFRNPANPFGEDFAEVISLNGSKATETANFVAVKLGDVNATYSANLVSTVVRNSNALTLNVEDMTLVAGNEYTVNVTANDFNAAAFQGTFNIANATIKSVKAGDLANYNDGNFGIFANAITTSWNGLASKTANVFTVTFTANKAGKLSEVLSVGSSLTPAVANDLQGNEMNINLKFSTGKVAGGEFALYQNTPNPVASETSIGFNMPKDGAAKLTIYNVEGKVVLNRNIDAKAGLNNVSISKSELSVSGVLYYRLETSEFSATKKMIIIE